MSHRFDEHYLSAANHSAKSYLNNPLAKHYAKCHTNMTPELEIKIIDIEKQKLKKPHLLVINNPVLTSN